MPYFRFEVQQSHSLVRYMLIFHSYYNCGLLHKLLIVNNLDN
jgi:hypothetical protein